MNNNKKINIYEDTPAEKDKLGRSNFVDELYNLIKNYNLVKDNNSEDGNKNKNKSKNDKKDKNNNKNKFKGSFIIDINAKWGDGKTSIINLLKEKFRDSPEKKEESRKEDKNYKFIDFDVWKVSKNNKNINDELYLQIFYKLCYSYKYFMDLKIIDCLFLWVSKIIKKFSQLFVLLFILFIIYIFYKFYKIIEIYDIEYLLDLFDGYNIEFAITILGVIWGFIKYYHHIIEKKDILKSLLKKTKDRKYIVVIDDFDRLEKDNICSLISFVKSNLDLPNLIFIFVYDRNVINTALKEKYEYDNFLDKIVNCQLDVPQIKERYLIKFLEDEINKIINLKNFDSYNYSQHCKKLFPYYFTNIREIKRFLNQFSNDYHMLVDTEIDNIEFLFIEIIKHFELKLYYFIMNNRDHFVENLYYYDRKFYNEVSIINNNDFKTITKEKARDFINQINEQIENNVKNKYAVSTIKSILKDIFPFIGKKVLNESYNIENDNHSFKDLSNNSNKISSYKSFYKYFQLDLKIEDFTESEYNSIITCNSFNEFKEKFEIKCKEKIEQIKKTGEDLKLEDLKLNFIKSQYFQYFDINSSKDILIVLYLYSSFSEYDFEISFPINKKEKTEKYLMENTNNNTLISMREINNIEYILEAFKKIYNGSKKLYSENNYILLDSEDDYVLYQLYLFDISFSGCFGYCESCVDPSGRQYYFNIIILLLLKKYIRDIKDIVSNILELSNSIKTNIFNEKNIELYRRFYYIINAEIGKVGNRNEEKYFCNFLCKNDVKLQNLIFENCLKNAKNIRYENQDIFNVIIKIMAKIVNINNKNKLFEMLSNLNKTDKQFKNTSNIESILSDNNLLEEFKKYRQNANKNS